MAKPVYLYQGTNAADLSVGVLCGNRVYGALPTLTELGASELEPYQNECSLFVLQARRITAHIVPVTLEEPHTDEPEAEVIFPIVSVFLDSKHHPEVFAQQLSTNKPGLAVRVHEAVLDNMSPSERMRAHTSIESKWLNGKQI